MAAHRLTRLTSGAIAAFVAVQERKLTIRHFEPSALLHLRREREQSSQRFR